MSTTSSSSVFLKRSLTFSTFIHLLTNIIRSWKVFRAFTINPQINHHFQEQIMLAVTSVNDCRYCSYYHTQIAIESGCTEEEVNAILKQDFRCIEDERVPALAFAQHFAESHEHPSFQALRQLFRIYGADRAKQIIASCFMITIGNLFGNTIEAYSSRFRDQPPANGSKWFEGLVYYLSIIPLQKWNG